MHICAFPTELNRGGPYFSSKVISVDKQTPTDSEAAFHSHIHHFITLNKLDPYSMTILLLGGTGKTSRRISCLLDKSNISVLLASRYAASAPAPFKACHFDWSNPSTYNNPFSQAADISAVYLIPPFTFDIFTPMKAFTELALTKGVRRFVFLSGSIVNDDYPSLQQFHQYLANLANLGVDYAILLPTWFMGTKPNYHC